MTAEAELATTTTAYDKLRAIEEKTPTGDAKVNADKEADAAQGKYGAATKAFKDAKREADKALKAYTTEPDKGDCRYQIQWKIEPQPLVADAAHRFVGDLRHMLWRSDTLELKTTPAGLLTGAEGESKDLTGDIIVQLVKTIAALGGPAPAVLFGFKPPKETSCPEIQISSIVDLTDKQKDNDVEELNKVLDKAKLHICVDGYPESGISKPPKSDYSDKRHDGIFYRRELPYVVELLEGSANADCSSGKMLASTLILSPNNSPIARIPFELGIFTTTKYNVTFEDGMLVSSKTERPSELMGLVSIPADIARSAISVLTEFVQLRVDYSSKSTALADQEAKLLDALKALKEKREELENGK